MIMEACATLPVKKLLNGGLQASFGVRKAATSAKAGSLTHWREKEQNLCANLWQ